MCSRRAALLFAGLLGLGSGAGAAAADGSEPSRPEWTLSASAYEYFLPEQSDYLQITVTADRDWLHLEGRSNYEDRETGSVWLGYNFEVGERVEFAVTPMLGGVFGRTKGIAPGCRASLDWRRLELYSEAEYVFDADDQADSFFYAWSELTLSPVDWLRVGIVGQRTRVYASERDIQRGVLVGFRYKEVEITTHAFDLDDADPAYVLSVAVDF